jgi:hypothetical protein
MVTTRRAGTGKILGFKNINVQIKAKALGKIKGKVGKKTARWTTANYCNVGPDFQYKIVII